jgi:uncharacterized protein YceK
MIASRNRPALAIALCVLTTGCAGVSKRLAPKLEDIPDGGRVVCESPCAVEWQRAQAWLVKHSKWKLQIATDELLVTYDPSMYDVSFGFTVTKRPERDGYSSIQLAAECANSWGCNPSRSDVNRLFSHYVEHGEDLLEGESFYGSVR